jgi:Fe-S oxidoreductase
MAPTERMAWAAGLDVPLAKNHPDFEILYWVGCAAAYDRRVQKIARSVVRLLQAAGVNFAVLGPEERCTGESARRMGDELLFQSLAEQNVATLTRHRVRRIVTHCPHCLNSLRNDYPQAGGHYEVVHHSQLLAELVEQGRLQMTNDECRMTNDQQPSSEHSSFVIRHSSLTYHDPCYLARASNITGAPRAVLSASAQPPSPGPGEGPGEGASSLPLLELPRNRRQTACCGGGGGRMWFDDPLRERVGQSRVREIAATGADTVAVSCPFCLIMLTDGLAAENPSTKVRDVAELLVESILGPVMANTGRG